jgi:hypothetical protein
MVSSSWAAAGCAKLAPSNAAVSAAPQASFAVLAAMARAGSPRRLIRISCIMVPPSSGMRGVSGATEPLTYRSVSA